MTDKRTPAQIAAERGLELDRRLGTVTPSLAQLEDVLYADYTTDGWGFGRLAGLADEEQRAIASDLILSAAEGVQVNLREMALCDIDVHELVGPNGRFMPGPDTTVDDLINGKRLHRAVTDFARGFGSTMDCLAAVTIGVLGIPASLQGASGSKLMPLPELPDDAHADQVEARRRVIAVFERHANAKPRGWLAWALEFRNVVIHRGHLTQTYLPRPGLSGAKVHLRSSTPGRYLTRYEPHLRAKPWQPDMLTMTDRSEDTLWLPEPVQETTAAFKRRTVALAEAVAAELAEVASRPADGWALPAAKWALERDVRKPQAVSARAFTGFDHKYPVPQVHAMAVHPRSAERLALAEQLRVRLAQP